MNRVKKNLLRNIRRYGLTTLIARVYEYGDLVVQRYWDKYLLLLTVFRER